MNCPQNRPIKGWMGRVLTPNPLPPLPLRSKMEDEEICQQQSVLCQREKETLACPVRTITSVICK